MAVQRGESERYIIDTISSPDVVEEFLAQFRNENTLRLYQRVLELFRAWCLESDATRVSAITEQNIPDIPGFSESSKRLYLVVIKRFVKWCYLARIYNGPQVLITASIADDEPRGVKVALYDEEAEHLLENVLADESVAGVRDHTMIHLMLNTGIRQHSAYYADLGDFEESEDGPILWYRSKRKISKNSCVDVPHECIDLVRRYVDVRGGESDDTSPVFTSVSRRSFGERLSHRSINEVITTRMKKAGIARPGLTPHSLRHTAAIKRYEETGDIDQVRKMLGHKNSSTTGRYLRSITRPSSKKGVMFGRRQEEPETDR